MEPVNQDNSFGNRVISRRGFLKAAATVGGAAVASMVIAACGAQPTTAPANTPAPVANTPAAAAPTSAPVVLKPKGGGKLTWCIEQDPVNLVPYGSISTSNQWGKEF